MACGIHFRRRECKHTHLHTGDRTVSVIPSAAGSPWVLFWRLFHQNVPFPMPIINPSSGSFSRYHFLLWLITAGLIYKHTHTEREREFRDTISKKFPCSFPYKSVFLIVPFSKFLLQPVFQCLATRYRVLFIHIMGVFVWRIRSELFKDRRASCNVWRQFLLSVLVLRHVTTGSVFYCRAMNTQPKVRNVIQTQELNRVMMRYKQSVDDLKWKEILYQFSSLGESNPYFIWC